MDSTQTTSLMERALRMAFILRRGGPAGVVFHADRGTQYTSTQLNDVCAGLGIRQSVGRTGVCWDNAMQLGHPESRVLRPPALSNQTGRDPGHRTLDRGVLQLRPAPLKHALIGDRSHLNLNPRIAELLHLGGVGAVVRHQRPGQRQPRPRVEGPEPEFGGVRQNIN